MEGEDDSEAIKVIKKNDQDIIKYKYKFEQINQWRILFYFIRFYVKNNNINNFILNFIFFK